MVFIDTGAFLARYLKQDAFHVTAVATWKKIAGAPLFTTNYVLSELTLLARRAGGGFAADRAASIYNSNLIETSLQL